MNAEVDNRLNSWIKAFPRFAGAAAIAVGSIVIVGWILDIQLLKSIHPNLVSMKANAAIAFVLSGMSLWLHSASGTGKQRMAARFLASLVLLVGLLTVAEYAFTWDAGIDQLIFNEPQRGIGIFSPGRMPLNAAISFCLLGLAFLTLRRRNRWGDGTAHILALIVGSLGLLSLIAYVYGLSEFSGYAVYARMALHGAGTFIFLSAGILCLQPDVGMMLVITGQGSGGFMARRLMLAAVGLPVVLGWLIVGGETWGWYGAQFGDVIFATAYIAIALVLVWRIARSLNRIDAGRKLAESELLESEIHFKELYDNAPVGYHELDDEGRLTRINQTELQLLGYDVMEMQGHFVWEFLDDQKASREAVLAKLSGTRPPVKNVERLYRRKDETTIAVMIEDRLLWDAQGRIIGIRTTLQDVTELKRAQKLLQESEEKYRTLVQNLAEGVGILDGEERFRFANPAAETLFGVPTGSLVGRNLREFMDPSEFEKIREQTVKRRKGETGSYEIQIIRPDGEKRHLLATASPLIQNDGAFGGSIAIFRDLTERMRAEEALAWEEYLLNALLENVPDHIYFKDTESRFTRISRDQAKVFGLSDPSQAVGKTDFDFFTGEHARLAYEDEQEIIRTGRSLSKEEKETWPDRLDTWVLTTKMPLRDKEGKIIGTFGISRDITERKRAEDVLKDSESSLRYAQEIAKMGSWEWNMVTQETNWSDSYFAIHGLKPTEVEPSFELFRNKIHPEDVHFLDETHANIMKARTPAGVELRIVQPDGTVKWIQNKIAPVIEDDKLVGLKGVIIDVTERKLAEKAVIASELELRRVWESTFDGMRVVDEEGTILMVNEAYCTMIGKRREELVGKPFSIFTVESLQRQTLEKHMQRFSSGTVAPRAEKELVLWNGRRVWFEVSSSFLEIKGRPKALLSIFRDVTDRKQAEDALAKKTELFRLVSNLTTDYIFVDRITDHGKTKLDLLIGAVEQITGYTEEEYRAIGDWGATVHPDDREKDNRDFLKLLNNEKVVSEIRTFRKDGSIRWMKIYAHPIWDEKEHRVIGISGAVQDITEQKRAEQERELLISELKTALENVKTLGGLVPICAHCKKIRDDKGYWNQLEKYLGDHTDAKLTHGLCPDCTKLYFPGIAAE